MDGETSNQPPTPPKGGTGEATESSSDKRGNRLQNESPPRRRKKAWKRLGLSGSKWREFSGFAVLIPWVWYDFLDCHIFSRLCLLAVCLAIAQGAVCSFWGASWKTISLWLTSLIPIAAMAYENSRSEPAPHFTFSLITEDAPDDPLDLTNDFLMPKDWSHPFKVFGLVLLPVHLTHTNIPFIVVIRNNSSETPTDLQLSVAFSANVPYRVGYGWVREKMNGPTSSSGTNEVIAWHFELHDILPGDSQGSPPLLISPQLLSQTYFDILLRAKDLPATLLSFSVVTFPVPADFPPQKGIVLEGRPRKDGRVDIPWPDIITRLHK